MGVFNKGKKNSKYSYLDEKLRRLDEDLKKTGFVSSTEVRESIPEVPKITLPKNPSKEDIKLVSEYLDTHSKSNWRNEYRVDDSQRTREERVEEEITKLRLQRKPQKKIDCFSCVTESDLKNKKIIKEEVTFEDKVNKILQIYNEGLLNIPPNENTPDPLTPTDGKFVTFGELNNHYNLFINRIQQQLSTLGGGGEVRLQYLDDIVGIATNASAYDNKYLKYDNTIQKFIFSDINSSGISTLGIDVGISTFNNKVIVGGATTALHVIGDARITGGLVLDNSSITFIGVSDTVRVGNGLTITSGGDGYFDGLVSADYFVGDGSGLTNTPIPAGVVTTAGIATYATLNYVDSAISSLVDTAPGTLDTLNELAAALNDDANFSSTITNSLAQKANLSGANFTGVVTASSFDGYATTAGIASYSNISGYANISGLSTNSDYSNLSSYSYYSDSSGIATVSNYSLISGIATYSSDSGIATYASNSGVSTYASTSGISTYANSSGISTYSSISGISTYATNSGIATYASNSGVSTYSTTAGVSTNATRINTASGGGNDVYLLFTSVAGASSSNLVYNNINLSYNQNSNTLILQNISASGVVTATDFNSTSDIALKENVELIDNPLDKLLELRGVTFEWKENKKSGVGVVAQDVEKVLPQAVGGSKDHKTVNYNAIIGLLVESVKQQQKEIDDLRKRLS